MFRRWGFCGWSFLPSNNEVLAVEDLTNDARRALASHSACHAVASTCLGLEEVWAACQIKPRAREDLSSGATHGAYMHFHQSDGCQPMTSFAMARMSVCGYSMQAVCSCSLDLGKHSRIPVLDARRALRCRFSDNAFILEEPKLKFYLAAPLVTTNGHRLGTLCVVGQKARRFTAEQANMLAGMAELVVRHPRNACWQRAWGLRFGLALAWLLWSPRVSVWFRRVTAAAERCGGKSLAVRRLQARLNQT